MLSYVTDLSVEACKKPTDLATGRVKYRRQTAKASSNVTCAILGSAFGLAPKA